MPSTATLFSRNQNRDFMERTPFYKLYFPFWTLMVLICCSCAHARSRGYTSVRHVDPPYRNRDTGLFTHETRGADGNCDAFKFRNNSFTSDGDYTLLVFGGHPTSPSQCKRTCVLQHEAAYCTGAVRHQNGSCFLNGYKVFRNASSQHFRRICDVGRRCFKKLAGWESRFHTGFVAIPEDWRASVFMKADFCRKECESLSHCEGFDIHGDLNYCPYLQMRPSEHVNFNLYERQCANQRQITG